MSLPKEVIRGKSDFKTSTLYTANRILFTKDIKGGMEVSDGAKVAKLIADRLKQGDSVVIEDGSHGMVYGIRAISARKIEIIKINRFSSSKEGNLEKRTITDPKLEVQFFLDPNKDSSEVAITINGRENGNGGSSSEIFKISSNGKIRPRPFKVIACREIKEEYDLKEGEDMEVAKRRIVEEDILLARAENGENGSLTCALEYRMGTKWVASCSARRGNGNKKR